MSTLGHGCDPRHQLLVLACEVSLYRSAGGRRFDELIDHVATVARLAALAGIPVLTPYTELFAAERDKYGHGEPLGWHYRRAYALADPSLTPGMYFSVSYANNFVTIRSTGENGAKGGLSINFDSVGYVFDFIKSAVPDSYRSWANDPYPVGGAPRLLRLDAREGSGDIGQIRIDAGDLHPCSGAIDLGHPVQECEQLAAFCRLEDTVRGLFAAYTLTEAQRADIRSRAAAIRGEASSHCDFPPSGLCFSCGADVTLESPDLVSAALTSGCPICSRSWCD